MKTYFLIVQNVGLLVGALIVFSVVMVVILRHFFKTGKVLEDMYLKNINEENIVEHIKEIARRTGLKKIIGSRAVLVRVSGRNVLMTNGEIAGVKRLMNELCFQVSVQDKDNRLKALIFEQDSGDWISFKNRSKLDVRFGDEFISLPFIDSGPKENAPPEGEQTRFPKSNSLNEGNEQQGLEGTQMQT